MPTRRQILHAALVSTGSLGLRALASGLPPSFLLHPRAALARMTEACAASDKAQFIIFNTSGAGDPINASVPGSYDDAMIVHSPDPALAPTPLSLADTTHTAAAPWASLPQAVLDRSVFFHLMTNTPVHPKEPDVLKLMNATRRDEMLPSLLAQQLAPCLGTIQSRPMSLGAKSPSEALSYQGQTVPSMPALALKATLTNPDGPISDLQALRDQTLADIHDVYRNQASPAQRNTLDALITSQNEVRSIRQDLLAQLTAIEDNSVSSQITAAITLIQMKVTPVITVHIPFGGDNHRDIGLATEAAETVSGVAAIASLFAALQAAGLSDQVTFLSLNVFGRTLGPGNADGRQHNPNHQVSIAIGKAYRGGVIGGIGPVANDYGALAIDAKTGKASADGDVLPAASLASFGRTTLAAVGTDADTIATLIPSGKVLSAALS
jgi:hypothetical protein